MTAQADAQAMREAMQAADGLTCWMGWVPPRPSGRRASAKGIPREVDAVDALDAAGLRAWTPVELHLRSRGKQRLAQVERRVLAPGVVFLWADATGFHRAVGTGHVSHLQIVPRRMRADLDEWIGRVEDAAAEVRRDQQRGRVEQVPYQPGEALRVSEGPLADMVARFVRLAQNAEGFPVIEAEVDFMGGKRRTWIDPLSVRKDG